VLLLNFLRARGAVSSAAFRLAAVTACLHFLPASPAASAFSSAVASTASTLVSSYSPLIVPALVIVLLVIARGDSWPVRSGAAAVCLAAAAACLPGAAAATVDSCPRLYTTREPYAGHVSLVDHEKRIMLLFNPKGGATVSAQLFFRYLGVIDEAYNYSRWIHDYRLKVFNGKPNHSPLSCTPALCAAGWVCIRLIRQPLDRVVSSYQFSLQGCSGIAMHWDELRLLKLGERAARMSKQDQAKLCLETTFTEFIQALTMRALKGRKARHTLADDHFMPQHASPEVDKCDGSATHANGTTLVYLVPVEFLDQAVSALGSTTGVVFNATGLNSSHYRKQDQNTMDRNVQLQGLNVPSWPFSRVNAQHPPYELFTSVDANISRRTCCLFRDDIAMYRRACRQPWLQQCAPCVQECSRQLARLRNVCEHGERSVIDESLAFHMGPSMAMRGPLPDAPAPLPDAPAPLSDAPAP